MERKRPYKTPRFTLRSQLDKFLGSARTVGEPERTPFGLGGEASVEARQALRLLAKFPDPAKTLWLALFALDSDLEKGDPRAALVLVKDVGHLTGRLRSLGDEGRIRLPLKWESFQRKLERLEREIFDLEQETKLLLVDRDTDRENMATDLQDALSQFAEWVRALRPTRSRGAPRRAANDYGWRRAGQVFYYLHREGMSATEIRKLVEYSSRDWSPVPPIRPATLPQMTRNQRSFRDRITTLIREGKRELGE